MQPDGRRPSQHQLAIARFLRLDHTKHCNISFFLVVSRSNWCLFLSAPAPFSSLVGHCFPHGFRDMRRSGLHRSGVHRHVLVTHRLPPSNELYRSSLPAHITRWMMTTGCQPNDTDGDEELGYTYFLHLHGQPSTPIAPSQRKTGMTTRLWPPPWPTFHLRPDPKTCPLSGEDRWILPANPPGFTNVTVLRCHVLDGYDNLLSAGSITLAMPPLGSKRQRQRKKIINTTHCAILNCPVSA
jgi:hypothetical protein